MGSTVSRFPCDDCFQKAPDVRDCKACQECLFALHSFCIKDRVNWDFVNKVSHDERYPCDMCYELGEDGIKCGCQFCAFIRHNMFTPSK